MDVSLVSYKYTEAWAALRGINTDVSVRGVIAQDVKHIAPFDARVDIADYKDGEFELESMYKVDKQGLTLDLIAAVQAKHGCFMPIRKSEDLAIQTTEGADSGAVTVKSGGSCNGDSGSLRVTTGSAVCDAGGCKMKTGKAGVAGDIAVMGANGCDAGALLFKGGTGGAHGGEILLDAGSGFQSGGNARVASGNRTRGANFCCATPKMGFIAIGPSGSPADRGGITTASAAAGISAVAKKDVVLATRGAECNSGDVSATSEGSGSLHFGSTSSTTETAAISLGVGAGGTNSGVAIDSGKSNTARGGILLFHGGSGPAMGGRLIAHGGNGTRRGGLVNIDSSSNAGIALIAPGTIAEDGGTTLLATGSAGATGAVALETALANDVAGAIHIAATSSAAFKGGGISVRAGDVAGGDADPYAGNVEFSSGKGNARSGGVVLENRAGGTKAGFSIIGADWGSVAGGTALLHAGEGDSAGGLACLSGGGTTRRQGWD